MMGSTPRSFELTIPSCIEEMHAVHALFEQAVKEYELPEEFAYWIELAISESMINAIKHGNKSDPSKTATLKLSIDGENLEIIVQDEGKGFELETVADPTEGANLFKSSGRGILIIRSFMDRVDLTKFEGGSILRMVKRLPEET